MVLIMLLFTVMSFSLISPTPVKVIPGGGSAGVIKFAISRGMGVLKRSRDYFRRKKSEQIMDSNFDSPNKETPVGKSEAAQSQVTSGEAVDTASVFPLAASVSPAPFSSLSPTLLSIDFHISPIQDLKYLLKGHFPGVVVSDRSLSGACSRTGTCANPSNLAVLRQGDVSHSMYFGSGVREEFFNAYCNKGVSDMVAASAAMVCSHPTGMCELAMPFNRSLILWATTRFEQGRERHKERFSGFIKNFRAMASLPGSVVLANNMYDVHYIQYFTGIKPVYAPSHCAYPGVSWSWKPDPAQPKPILVHGYRPHRGGVSLDAFLSPLRSAGGGGWEFAELRAALGHDYAYATLAGFPAILHLPYQVSIMSFFEHYRMGIPILAPSRALLTKWHMETLFVSERTWDTVLYNTPTSQSAVSRHADATQPYDPNDETSEDAVSWWLQWADYYVFPHVILFDSWEDLALKIKSVDLPKISAAMKDYSSRQVG